MSEYFIHLGILVCIYLILSQSLNLAFGKGGLFNLAHAAAYAVGAYATAILSTELEVGTFRCLLFSMLFSGLTAIIVGAISLKLTKDYFAIGTLAFASIVQALLINWKDLTRGVLGISDIPRPVVGEIDFYQNINFLIFAALCAIAVNAASYLFFYNSYGRSLSAQAEFDEAAQALGKDTRIIRLVSFFIGCACAGLAGSLFAYYLNYIDPSSFAFSEMVFVMTIVVVGRPGSFWGCIAATFFLVLLPEPLRFLEIPSSILGPMRQLLHSLILFFIVWINREKLFPVQRRV